MKTEWDYTKLADAYLKRPEYAQDAIDQMLATAGVSENARICDVGAGAAHLTLMLAKKGHMICAVEPNDAMRKNGVMRTADFPNVQWFEGVGEHTGMKNHFFNLVTFGSSFNVCDRQQALAETARILKPNGWFACMWNHRDLNDPLQVEIEKVIKKYVADYSYGTRREDQTDEINKSGLFHEVKYIEAGVVHTIDKQDFIDGWKSHGTLARQSKEQFDLIIDEIAKVVEAAAVDGYVKVPYVTRVWVAQAK